MINTPKKILSAFSLAMINVIAIDSLRNLPINAEYGLSIVTLYLLGSLFFLVPCILITAELATYHPKTGGSYHWVKLAFGDRIGFASAWLQWIYNVAWFPTIVTFIVATMTYLTNPSLSQNKWFILPAVIIIFGIATLVNCFGMRLSSWVSTFGAIIGTIVPMLVIIALAAIWVFEGKSTHIDWHASRLLPDLSHFGNLSFMVTIIFSLIGIELSAVHAGDVKNPKRDYPKALWMSGLFIVASMILSSLAVAIILPKSSINIVNGLNQAFYIFLYKFNLEKLFPIALLTIIIGGFAGMAAWIIGPAKALMVAATDGCAPKSFSHNNRFGAPVFTLVMQFAIVILLCSLFLIFHTVSQAYWVLSDITAQLALIYYIILFAAAIKLRRITPKQPHAFRIPGGNWGIKLTGIIGIITCVVILLLGFLPPTDVSFKSLFTYESALIIGILIFCVPPFLIARRKKI